jgi:Protein of unknown function (DUF3604)
VSGTLPRRIPPATPFVHTLLLCLGVWIAPPSLLAAQCPDRDPLRRPFFGDLHVHTALSFDAATQDTRNRPADAYRFARGEAVGVQPYAADGRPLRTVRLRRPLDFTAVTDHAELFGEQTTCSTTGLPGHDSLVCRLYRRWPRLAYFVINSRTSGTSHPTRYSFCGPGPGCGDATLTPWREIQTAALEANAPCQFTTIVGYEWTGGPDGKNLHRNVLFATAEVPALPVSAVEEPDPWRLPERLTAACAVAGPSCRALAIPHNSNLSGGLMWRLDHLDGTAATPAEMQARAGFERLVEVMQHKGDSECGPGGATEDELCGFEKLPYDSFRGKYQTSQAHRPDATNYVRHALSVGLREEARHGVNPFPLGFVGSTDTHLGTPGAVDERGYPGHGGAGMPSGDSMPAGLQDDVEYNPGGLAGVWAEENTREALFAALYRRETWATSGPRLVVRTFTGWGLDPDLCRQPDLAARASVSGVPMGAILPKRPNGARPQIVVSAAMDPGTAEAPGTPLERVQIVKGWVGADGVSHERVYDVAGGAVTDADSVDLATCAQRPVGTPTLCTVWSDPEFDPAAHAFWYARVLEVPTCRWTTRACAAAGIRCDLPASVPPGYVGCCDVTQPRTARERAWTSPVWYAPTAN